MVTQPPSSPPSPGTPKQSGTLGAKLMLVCSMLVGAAFLPVAVIFIVGMVPSIVAFFVDSTREKTRAFTVGLLNFVTCFPFMLDVAMKTQTLSSAYVVLMDPLNIVIMFTGAVAGYFLDWTMAGISNVIMTAHAKNRLEAIDKRQAELKRRFGPEVAGDMPLDVDGFPLHKSEG